MDERHGLITGPGAADLVLNDRILRHLPLIELDEVTIGRKVDYWREWWEHQDKRRLLAGVPPSTGEGERADLPAGRLVRPVLRVASEHFAAIGTRVPNRVMIGPWSHEEEVEKFTADIDLSPALTVIRDHELDFFDRYLKDVENGWEDRAPAELYVLGADAWRGEQEWPPSGMQVTPLYLRQSGGLTFDEPRADEPGDQMEGKGLTNR